MTDEQEQRLEKIIGEYAWLLETREPVIADADLLPYPKDVIYAALEWKEQKLLDTANGYLREGHPKAPEHIEKHLNAVQGVKMALAMYATIDAEDRERVDYFNTFKRWADVTPQEDFMECSSLRVKYSGRGLEQYSGK